MKHRFSTLHLIFVAVAAITALTAMARRSSSARWDAAAMERKADYIYLEALNRQLDGADDAYYELLAHAFQTDPGDEETANAYALYLIHLEHTDSDAVARGLQMMRRYFDRHPDDLYSSLNYALLSQQFGAVDEALRAYGTVHRLFPGRTGISYRYADMLAQSGSESGIDSALAVYDSLEVTEGPSIELTSARLRVLFQRQDTAAVLAEARRLLASAPQSVENNVLMADVFSSFNRNDSAIAYLDRACAIDTTNAMAYYSRAGFYHNIGDSAAFDREIFHVLKMDNLDIDVKMGVMRSYIGELYGDSLQEPRILDLFSQLVDMHPHESELRQFYAAYLYTINRSAQAAAEQERAMDLAPDQLQGWTTLVSMQMSAGQWPQANASIVRALTYFPDSYRLYMMHGSVMTELDSLDSAVADFHRAIQLADSNDVELLSDLNCWIGDVRYQQGQRDSAFTYYHRAIDLNPLNMLALNNAAYYMAVEGCDLDDALRYIERVVQASEPQATWLDTYAWVLFRRKEYAKAREQIDRALQLDQEPGAEELEHAGDIYYMDGDPGAALDFWQRALRLDPDNKLLRRKVKNKAYYFD